MKKILIIIVTILVAIMIYKITNSHKTVYKSMLNTDQNFKNEIHESAKSILTDDFYWDIDNPNSPFSTNRVTNTFQEYIEWRKDNINISVLKYFPEIGENELVFDRNATDVEAIKSYFKIYYELHKNMHSQFDGIFDTLQKTLNTKITPEEQKKVLEESANQMGVIALKEHDDMIISAGFGQFVTEGKIDKELKILTKKAISRQLLPFVLDEFGDKEFQEKRQKEFEVMLNDLTRVE
jgi:uncharacterized protein YfeS